MKFNFPVLSVCTSALLYTISDTYMVIAKLAVMSKTLEISWWTFKRLSDHFVGDTIKQKKDSVFGNFEYVPGISRSALKLDGFRTYIRRNANSNFGLENSFTV
jgi:hypothetical protein